MVIIPHSTSVQEVALSILSFLLLFQMIPPLLLITLSECLKIASHRLHSRLNTSRRHVLLSLSFNTNKTLVLLILARFFFPLPSSFATFHHMGGLYQKVQSHRLSSVPRESHTSGESNSNSFWIFSWKWNPVSLWGQVFTFPLSFKNHLSTTFLSSFFPSFFHSFLSFSLLSFVYFILNQIRRNLVWGQEIIDTQLHPTSSVGFPFFSCFLSFFLSFLAFVTFLPFIHRFIIHSIRL